MENKEYYVYLHIKATTGEPFYVGQGKNKRAYEKNKYRRSQYWINVSNKYGVDIIFLEKDLTFEESLEKEIYWIKRIGRKTFNNGPLINLTDGGEGFRGYKHTEENKKKYSINKLGNKNPMYGKPSHKLGIPLSDETKEKIKLSKKEYFKTHCGHNKNKPMSEEQKIKLSFVLKEYFKTNDVVNKIKVDDNILKQIFSDYDNGVKEFALHKKYNLSRTVIKRIINNYEDK